MECRNDFKGKNLFITRKTPGRPACWNSTKVLFLRLIEVIMARISEWSSVFFTLLFQAL
jgi:hypothetical protein